MDESLLRPTIPADSAPAGADGGTNGKVRRPWNPDSLAYPAVFGGALAATVLGLVNSRRLGLGARAMIAIAGIGALAIAGRVLAFAFLDLTGHSLGALSGVAVWGVTLLVQKPAYRAFLYRQQEPASLLGPGLVAAIVCGLVEGALTITVLLGWWP